MFIHCCQNTCKQPQVETVHHLWGANLQSPHCAAGGGGAYFLDSQDFRDYGDLFISLLCRMKHNGAVEKCMPGYICLIKRCVPCLLAGSLVFTPHCRPRSNITTNTAGLFRNQPHRMLRKYGCKDCWILLSGLTKH
jgi:hypothetical protein